MLVTRGSQEVVNSVATNKGAHFSEFGFLHMIQRAEGDSILAEQLGPARGYPPPSVPAADREGIRRRQEAARKRTAGMVDQIKSAVADVAGALQSKFGPVSRGYFVAKRVVATQHRQGNLNENSISVYARSHKLEEVTIGLSLLCALPADVIERALQDRNREMLLILAKALDFSWATTMSLLFLGAKDHRITAKDLNDLENEFGRLNIGTSRSVLEFYQSRKNIDATEAAPAGAPCIVKCGFELGSESGSELGGGLSTMNATAFRAPLRQDQRGRIRRSKPPGWFLEAANDLGDHVTVEICRRVIDAGLNGREASPSDQHIVLDYFR